MFFEEITIINTKQQKRSFLFPCGYDSFGNFENHQVFKEICTKNTQQALESMDIDKKAKLYKPYTRNIQIIFNGERNSNVFMIDFLSYKQEIENYLRGENE